MKLYKVTKFDCWYNYGAVEGESYFKEKHTAELWMQGKNTNYKEGDWFELSEITTED